MKKRVQIQAKPVVTVTARDVSNGEESINFTKIQFDKLLKKHLRMPVSVINL